MKYFAVLAIGILLGFALGRFPFGETKAPQLFVAEQFEESATAPPPEPVAAAEPPTSMQQANASPPPTAPAPESTDAQDPGKEPVQLVISEQLADQMEENWDDLPNQLHIMKEENGYRVIYVQDGSLASQTGLQSGDLITRESLGSLDRGQAERVARILSHVAVY